MIMLINKNEIHTLKAKVEDFFVDERVVDIFEWDCLVIAKTETIKLIAAIIPAMPCHIGSRRRLIINDDTLQIIHNLSSIDSNI